MPTYDYRCKTCGHELEVFQSMSDKPKRKCPKCGKQQLERLIGTGAAVLFKGSGFYQTDYRSKSYKEAAKADGKAKDGSGSADTNADKKSTKASSEKAAPAKPAPPKGD